MPCDLIVFVIVHSFQDVNFAILIKTGSEEVATTKDVTEERTLGQLPPTVQNAGQMAIPKIASDDENHVK